MSRKSSFSSSWHVLGFFCQNPLIESICCIMQSLKVISEPFLPGKDIFNCLGDGGIAIIFLCCKSQKFPFVYQSHFIFQSVKKKIVSVNGRAARKLPETHQVSGKKHQISGISSPKPTLCRAGNTNNLVSLLGAYRKPTEASRLLCRGQSK